MVDSTRPRYAQSPDMFTTNLISDASQLNPHAHTVQIIMVLGYAVMSFLCFVLIFHLRRNRSDARKGDSSAARKLLLPTFEPLLWILGIATGSYALTMLTITVLGLFRDGTPRILSELFYCGRQFVFLLAMVFMLQKSVSVPALGRSVAISLALATYTLPVVIYMTYWGEPDKQDTYYVIQRVLRLVLVAAFLYIFLRPPSRASKASIRSYCCFTFIYQALSFASSELNYVGYRQAGSLVTYCALIWAALVPLVIWRLLLADTEHWRGMGQRACALQNAYRQKNQMQEHVSAQGLHVLIEMHRKLVIDFAYLELKRRIGVGSSAVVYDGWLHSYTPVATKVYTPLALTDEVVANFSHEAALCAALHHPNIVRFYGMCVCPPTIGLVFELCQGSLETVLRANANREFHKNHQTTMINLGYLLDAARAVAYLHSFSPRFLHRDIKPANFLVDSDYNVKLSDFGESRSLTTGDAGKDDMLSSRSRDTNVLIRTPTVLERCESTRAQEMTVKGTVDYMAPELINGKGGYACYGEAADIFSLAMTMWDILHPGEERYPACRDNHLQVFQAVLDGKRPAISPDLHPTLQELICSAWHMDARLRPSAQIIVSTLESIQEEVCAEFLAETFWSFGVDVPALTASDDEDNVGSGSSSGVLGGSSRGGEGKLVADPICGVFSGVQIVWQLVSLQYADCVGEANRMGRMWMDTGLLHHVKHARGFSDDNATYYLDEERVRMCRPPSNDGAPKTPLSHRMSASGRRKHTLSTDSQTPSETSSRRTSNIPYPMCACRKHGQRQNESTKPERRKTLKRQKFQTISEANLLTASLLTPDEGVAELTERPSDFGWFSADTLNVIVE